MTQPRMTIAKVLVAAAMLPATAFAADAGPQQNQRMLQPSPPIDFNNNQANPPINPHNNRRSYPGYQVEHPCESLRQQYRRMRYIGAEARYRALACYRACMARFRTGG